MVPALHSIPLARDHIDSISILLALGCLSQVTFAIDETESLALLVETLEGTGESRQQLAQRVGLLEQGLYLMRVKNEI